ncbi:MAG: flagellar filament capping protein FliD, partial [Candidatus Kapabacteria bacterium]|nr:flagellar filament capping protein FliD [Candidatus Kapabacteria bacterium]
IQKLLDSYNAALKELTNALGGPFKSDTSLRQLSNQLRSLSSQHLGNGPLQSLRDIGITVNKDGLLTLSDRSRLEQELAYGSERIASLFTSAGGLGERIAALLQDVTGSS